MKTHSFLPNSSPEILKPLQMGDGWLKVVWSEPLDSHVLMYEDEAGTTVIASHHNGFSCHSLAKQIIAGDKERAIEQLEYIQGCGGKACSKILFDGFFAAK